jgi:hypothetical protein
MVVSPRNQKRKKTKKEQILAAKHLTEDQGPLPMEGRGP